MAGNREAQPLARGARPNHRFGRGAESGGLGRARGHCLTWRGGRRRCGLRKFVMDTPAAPAQFSRVICSIRAEGRHCWFGGWRPLKLGVAHAGSRQAGLAASRGRSAAARAVRPARENAWIG
jgi:hypothetical protein